MDHRRSRSELHKLVIVSLVETALTPRHAFPELMERFRAGQSDIII